jgi:hypothetical protein
MIDLSESAIYIAAIVLFPAAQGLFKQRFPARKMPIEAALGDAHPARQWLNCQGLNTLLGYQFQCGPHPVLSRESNFLIFFNNCHTALGDLLAAQEASVTLFEPT